MARAAATQRAPCPPAPRPSLPARRPRLLQLSARPSPRPRSPPLTPRPRLLQLLAAAAAVAILSLSSGVAASRYDSPGPYAVARSRVLVAANGGGLSGVADQTLGGGVNGGEEGELVVYHPVGTAAGTLLPFTLYQHPTHGWRFEGWATQNEAMLRLLASHGVSVFCPVRVGSPTGVGNASMITGMLLPGGESTAEVEIGQWFPRLQAFILHALMQVARRSDADPSFAFFEKLDVTKAALMGFSTGPALTIYAVGRCRLTV